jgi:hypothetical protein
MAFVKLLHGQSTFCRVVFFVDAAVGRRGANIREDVLLIQFMLKMLWGKVNPKTNKTTGAPGTPPPAVDGLCGPKTIAAIEAFQGAHFPRPELVDGRIDPVRQGQSMTFGQDEVRYTIIKLNVAFGHHFGIDRHHFMAREPGYPFELTMKFYYMVPA